jgi:hypothetical protein
VCNLIQNAKEIISFFGHSFCWISNFPLTLWHKNPKVHHHTHNSPPLVPSLCQSNPIHTLQANLPKIHSDPIYTLVLRVVSFLRAFPPKPCTLFSPLPCVPHVPPPHSPWLDLPNDIWGWVQSINFLHSHVISSLFGPNIKFPTVIDITEAILIMYNFQFCG